MAAESSKALASEEVEDIEVAHDDGGDDGEKSASTAKKFRVPQEMIDFVLSWDVSDYVFATPEDMDDMSLSEEFKVRYRANRKKAVAVIQKRRAVQRQMQEWVRTELAKNGGYIEVETTAEMIEKHQLEEYIIGQTA